MSPVSSNSVPRKRLLACIDAPQLAPITLITAPAGYGKSTLVRQWAAQHPSYRYGWYQIRPEHNALSTFLLHLWHAIDESTGKSEPAPEHITIDLLLERLRASSSSTLLVLDDYHVIENESIHQVVEQIFRDLPSHAYIFLLSRHIPDIPLARLRAYGRVRQITQEDLAFTFEEVKQVFSGIDASDDLLCRITKKSEGWIAGLQLTLISVNLKSDSISEELDRLVAEMVENRLLNEYIVEEVLDSLPDDLRRFVLDTSVLDTLDPELCNSVLQISSSERLLDRLEDAIVFVGRPGGAGRPLTYHRLFAECMQRLRQRAEIEPSTAELRLRASRWHLARGDFEEAAEYALAAEAWNEAAKIISEFIPLDFAHTNVWDSFDWLGRLPESALRTDMPLFQSYISSLLGNGYIDLARPLVKTFLHAPEFEPTPQQKGWHANQCAYIAFVDGDRGEALYQSYQALGYFPPEDASGRLLAWSGIHREYCAQGERELAQEAVRQGEADHNRQSRDSIYWHSLITPDIANDMAIRGDLVAAEELNLHFIKTLPPMLQTSLGAFKLRLLCIHLEQDRLDLAAADVEDILADLKERHYLIWYSGALVGVANYYFATGDQERAWHTLQRSLQLTRQRGGRELIRKAETGIANYWLRTGQDNLAQYWADTTPLSPYVIRAFGDVDPRSLRAQLLFRQGRPHDAMALLTESLAIARSIGNVAAEIAFQVDASVVARAMGSRAEADAHLRIALELGAPGRFSRIYSSAGVDLSEEIRALMPAIGPAAREHAYSLVGTSIPIVRSSGESEWIEAGLTEREREVLIELVLGKSNREVAETLFITERTVKKHLANLFRKTDTSNRTALALWGRERMPGIRVPGNARSTYSFTRRRGSASRLPLTTAR